MDVLFSTVCTAQKMKFAVKGFFSRCDPADLITSTKGIFNGKLHFLCSAAVHLFLLEHVFVSINHGKSYHVSIFQWDHIIDEQIDFNFHRCVYGWIKNRCLQLTQFVSAEDLRWTFFAKIVNG